jgi:mRNA interferase HigB
MRIIAKKTLREFWEHHTDAQQSLQAWYADVQQADWKLPSDVKSEYRSVSFIANNRAVFNIKGNKYRVIVAIHYEYRIVYIRFVGTHAEYDAVDAATV